MTMLPNPEAVRARLAALRAGRGFLLPHHGAMAAALPDLHDAYGAMYAALAVTEHHLTPFEREFVWLCILVAGREPVGTHHAEAFSRAGGSIEQARVALHLTGYAGAADTLAFVDAALAAILSRPGARSQLRRRGASPGRERGARGDLPPGLGGGAHAATPPMGHRRQHPGALRAGRTTGGQAGGGVGAGDVARWRQPLRGGLHRVARPDAGGRREPVAALPRLGGTHPASARSPRP